MKVSVVRRAAGLSRPELARFLGVSEATVVRWENDARTSEPKGVQVVLLRLLVDALEKQPATDVARVVRSSSLDHRSAIEGIFDAARERTSQPDEISGGE